MWFPMSFAISQREIMHVIEVNTLALGDLGEKKGTKRK